jgi:hypothetical protein
MLAVELKCYRSAKSQKTGEIHQTVTYRISIIKNYSIVLEVIDFHFLPINSELPNTAESLIIHPKNL